jgi:murein DD-endopeptidase MepM/ murein hydrolase activator NlpD
MRGVLTVSILPLIALSCARAPTAPDVVEVCDGFAAWETSAYVLPYAVGSSYLVSHGNCEPLSSGGHNGVKKFGYDFDMAIGTPVLAARAGVVLQADESHLESEVSDTGNYVVVEHDDRTTALYGHITYNGVAVSAGDNVRAGTLIAYSGKTGNLENHPPQLHFSVQSCDPVSRGTAACPTLPVTFRNTDPNVDGLHAGRVYQAGPY